jgi:DNA repair photolyase
MQQKRAKPSPAARASRANPTGRFERHTVDAEGVEGGAVLTDEECPGPRTQVTDERTRSAIASNDSPDVPFEHSINPYRGCEHGCIYCFARPSHAYLGLSPGLDFETRIIAKPGAPAVLRRELSRKGYRPTVLALGANTDPYQPVERERRITRAILEVLAQMAHPVSIVTKSVLVLRDLDLLAEMAARRLAHVNVSITTLDRELARRMEPRASAPERRLDAIRELTAAGVPTSVLASPMIPGLNDHELEAILTAAREAGATQAGYILVRLPREVAELFEEWLEANYPLKAKHVLDLIRATRGGDLYRSAFGERMRGTGAYADMLATRFNAAKARLGFSDRSLDLDLTAFRAERAGPQLSLFEN